MLSKLSLEFELFLNRSFYPIEGILIDITTPDQSGPGSNVNGCIYHTQKISKADAILCHTKDTSFFEGCFFPL